ncbi:DUF3566 domain-containing protein [Corynebacterium sp. TAE3-ERU12]|uniref:DUF3566 domain-containing protein n=1 Tax=Corynebacterium sp. TAE3-ERU12 TaxID=2849491 RepID=UPI001C491F48|nr:DUF3566 domain-containing protein [Corynebacterium sp. TAE3-ERU12]MBV7294356.1 DUF3566 domain-containing protein [Corynebacterium sp. TAE3-ERU12]
MANSGYTELRRLDPWSMLRISAAVSVIAFLVWMITVAVMYMVLGSMGVWDSLNDLIGSDEFGLTRIFIASAVLGLLWAVLTTALLTLGAFIYNACAGLVGGAKLGLVE